MDVAKALDDASWRSRLALSQAERERFAAELAQLLQWAKRLEQFAAVPLPEETPTGESRDTSAAQDAVLEEAVRSAFPAREGGLLRVPRRKL